MFFRPLKEPDWESGNASELFDFLNSTTGKRLVAKLLWECPRYTEIDPTKRLVESGLIEGYGDCIRDIFAACEAVTNRKEQEEYPPLEDDAAWAEVLPEREE